MAMKRCKVCRIIFERTREQEIRELGRLQHRNGFCPACESKYNNIDRGTDSPAQPDESERRDY